MNTILIVCSLLLLPLNAEAMDKLRIHELGIEDLYAFEIKGPLEKKGT